MPTGYNGMKLYTYNENCWYLFDKAFAYNYIHRESSKASGLSNLLNDIAYNNIYLLDRRPVCFLDPPYQDHFMGRQGSTLEIRIIYIAPTPTTIQYFATFAYDHQILPKRNYSHLTAWANMVFHLMGLGWVVPEHWPVNTRRHAKLGGDSNLDAQFRHNPKPPEAYSDAMAAYYFRR
jgi:hypothetical protein